MDVKWIKITTTMFDDEKIRLIESMPDGDSVLVVWVKLLVQAGRTNAGGYLMLAENIPYTDEMLATVFGRPLSTVRLALDTFERFGMIERDGNGALKVVNWEKHQNAVGLEHIREQNRLRQQRRRAALKAGQEQKAGSNVTRHVTVTPSNAPDLDLDKEVDLDQEIKYGPEPAAPAPADDPTDTTPRYNDEHPAYQAAVHLISWIQSNNPRAKTPTPEPGSQMDRWSDDMDKLHRLGPPGGKRGYTWQEIKDMIDWCQQDTFWWANILSAPKLRQKAPQLENQMQRASPGGNGRTVPQFTTQGERGRQLVEKYRAEEARQNEQDRDGPTVDVDSGDV